jgi:hypothetical protein
MGLPAYMRLFAATCGLTDDDKKLGVRLIGISAVTTEASAAPRAREIFTPTVAEAEGTAAPSDGTSSVATGSQIPSHSNPLEDGSINLEMGQDRLPIGEPRPNHQCYNKTHLSSFLEEVVEEADI